MPLLQIVKPPSEKVSPGETHRIEEEQSMRVYHFMEKEWRLEPKHSFPAILGKGPGEQVPCCDPPVKDTFEPLFHLPTPPETKQLSVGDLRHYPIELIHTCAQLSDLSYCHHQDLLNDRTGELFLEQTDTGFPVLIHPSLEEGGCCYLWKSKNEKTMYISFRSTACMSAIINPLCELKLGSEVHGKVNREYLEWCSSIIPFIHERVMTVQSQIDHIVCTGHSLGAGYATIMAPALAHLFSSIKVSCITFGSPRVGDQEFGEWFRDRLHFSYRVITHGDPVSIVPMSGDLLHVADALAVDSDGKAENWRERIDGDVWNFTWHEILYFLRSSRLHHMSEYMDRLDKMKDNVSMHSRAMGL
jgi:hypothetical protein